MIRSIDQINKESFTLLSTRGVLANARKGWIKIYVRVLDDVATIINDIVTLLIFSARPSYTQALHAGLSS